jgi:hypothetical protein
MNPRWKVLAEGIRKTQIAIAVGFLAWVLGELGLSFLVAHGVRPSATWPPALAHLAAGLEGSLWAWTVLPLLFLGLGRLTGRGRLTALHPWAAAVSAVAAGAAFDAGLRGLLELEDSGWDNVARILGLLLGVVLAGGALLRARRQSPKSSTPAKVEPDCSKLP